MAILVLDLDLTCFVNHLEEQYLDKDFHQLSDESIDITARSIAIPVRTINRDKLSDLIEYAYKEHDGIMIHTAGCWDEVSVKNYLANYLDLSPETTKKIQSCHFINTDIMAALPELANLDFEVIRNMGKNIRHDLYVQGKPELIKTRFVFLDDSIDQFLSIENHPSITPVLATTRVDINQELLEDIGEFDRSSFYEAAKLLLIASKKLEQEAASNSTTREILQNIDQNSPKPNKTKKRERVISESERKLTMEPPPKKLKRRSLFSNETLKAEDLELIEQKRDSLLIL